ncbi:MAG TPA: cobaltochelatase subunit CobN, partial [Actinomycetota bacterium]|nr:cobaltochelatase subunit CobN [Actinomycetota bacterium]
PVADYAAWFATLPASARAEVTRIWGDAPGEVYVVDAAGGGRELVFPGIDLGGVLVTIQPPRGFGSDPIGAYHAPDVPPPHHYLAFYRWLDTSWGADAVVHVGKHGTLEWLPGKANALSGACYPDAALGDVPLVYPFVVNDPGEGTQAKRRTHAVIVDHLVPPMTRAEATDDVARLETLLNAYANAQAMDPSKLPALRRQVWDLLVEAEIHRDLGLDDGVAEDEFDAMVLHVDGYLCALKDAQIRGGLHVLGSAPEGEVLVEGVLAVTRLPQGPVPALRAVVAEALGFDPRTERRHEVDKIEAECRHRVEALAAAGWERALDPQDRSTVVEHWICDRLVPALAATPDEVANTLLALDGGYVPAGPSGAPTRGAAHVLPTGRNFYSVDPKALPSALSWDVGRALADELVARHVAETGAPPVT